MEIILLERIEKLGKIGDVVNVKDGYARNYLLPQKMALRATEENKTFFETQRKKLEERDKTQKTEAEKIAKKVADTKLVILRQAGEGGQLYGSVTSRDISDALQENGVEIDSEKVALDMPIKQLGVFEVVLRLHGEVATKIQVNVARSDEEAEAQAEDAVKAEEIFETKELAEQAEEKLVGKPEEEKEGEEDKEKTEEAKAEGDDKKADKEETANSGKKDAKTKKEAKGKKEEKPKKETKSEEKAKDKTKDK